MPIRPAPLPNRGVPPSGGMSPRPDSCWSRHSASVGADSRRVRDYNEVMPRVVSGGR